MTRKEYLAKRAAELQTLRKRVNEPLFVEVYILALIISEFSVRITAGVSTLGGKPRLMYVSACPGPACLASCTCKTKKQRASNEFR